MLQNFPLFQSSLDLAHYYWERLIQKGDWVIDATCGAGKDTLKAAEILLKNKGSGLIGIDIQNEALARTKELLHTYLLPNALSMIHLYCQSHSEFPAIASDVPIKLIIYNLGYLPRGNKQLTTMTHTTLESVQKGLDLLLPGGALSITCYPGHAEGAAEERALVAMAKNLPSNIWNICYHSFPNRTLCASFLLIQKSKMCFPSSNHSQLGAYNNYDSID